MGVATALAIGGAAAGLISAGTGIANAVSSNDKANAAAKQQAGQAADQQASSQQAIQNAQAGAQKLQPSVNAQQNLANQLAAQNGIGNQSQVYGQLQGVVNGTGPNPAQAMLAQQTGANTANQAALMAGQRGAGANAGLIARQAAMQGGANQQNAIGQGATLQANQSLNALSQAGGLATNQVNQQMQGQGAATQAAMNQQQLAQGLALGQSGNAISAQTNANNAAGQAYGKDGTSQQLGQQIGGAATALGTAATVGANMFPKTPELTSQPQSPTPSGGPSLGVNTTFATPTFKAEGGVIGPRSYVTDHLMGSKDKLRMALGGKVPAMVSPGEIYLKPGEAKAVAQGVADPMSGEKIPGKAKVKGNSLKNDTVPKTLDEGGVVIPKDILEGKNPHREAYKFVNAALGKAAMKRKS